MTVRIPLERVTDNPFQTRQLYAGIEELAESILKMQPARPDTSGLIQIPPARIVLPQERGGWKILDPDEYGGVESCLGDEPTAWVQIAAGHRRLRAFAHLNTSPPAGGTEGGRILDTDYATFPVEVLILDDQKMADIAWEENNQRKDLSPIEEAEALDRAITLFGWTQTKIGQRWGLSQSAVANKLRLLKLPDDAQAAIRDGRLTERHGRALLAAMKSETIYQKVSADIIPIAPNSDAAQIAQHLCGKYEFHHISGYYIQESDICGACQKPLYRQNEAYRWRDDVDRITLCKACYRAGKEEDPPSVDETTRLINTTISNQTRDLNRANFPTGDPIAGADDPIIVQPTCLGCPTSHLKGDDWDCFNRTCFEAKEKAHANVIYNQARARIAADYNGAEIEATSDYGGEDLSPDGVDKELIEHGVCVPGKCDRLRLKFKRIIYGGIQPYPDLPFVWNCNNIQSHRACQRRYLAAQTNEDTQSEAAQQAAAKEARKAAGRQVLKQAVSSVATALQDGHESAWRCLLDANNIEIEPGGNLLAGIEKLVAKTLMWTAGDYFGKYHEYLWESEDAVETLQKKLDVKLDKYGIPRAASAVEIITKIEKIHSFLYTARLDQTLTPEQLAGNCANAEKLLTQVRHLRDTNQLANGDARRLENMFIELGDELVESGEEIGHPIEKSFLISPEIV